MNALKDLRFFVHASRKASLSEAAFTFDITPAAARDIIRRLEDELGMKLFVRSIRRFRLTPDGERFLAQVGAGVDLLVPATKSGSPDKDTIDETIGMVIPSDIGRNTLLNWLHQFRSRHANLILHLHLSEVAAARLRERVDISLRYGKPLGESFVALPLAVGNRRVLCAAPAYLRRYGVPLEPNDLKDHNCLCLVVNNKVENRWRFTRDQRSVEVAVSGSFVCEDADVLGRLALLGEGIAYEPRLEVHDDLRAGRLVELCLHWQAEPAPLYIECAAHSAFNPAVRLLHAFLEARYAHLLGSQQ